MRLMNLMRPGEFAHLKNCTNMVYIKREPVTIVKLTCVHPKVKRIWEWGGAACIPTSGLFFRTISLLFDDDTRKDFTDDGNNDGAIHEAEKYLQSIQE